MRGHKNLISFFSSIKTNCKNCTPSKNKYLRDIVHTHSSYPLFIHIRKPNVLSNTAKGFSGHFNKHSNISNIVSTDLNMISSESNILFNDLNIISNDLNIISNDLDMISGALNTASERINIDS